MSLLEVTNLTVDLGHTPRVRVLDDVSLRVGAGESVGIVGESGSGKTTLARAVLRSVDAVSGAIELDGVDVRRLRGAALRRWRRSGAVQYVFQDPLRSLDPGLSIRDSVSEGLRLRRATRSEGDAAVDAALEDVGLSPEQGARLPAQLSGGQRQRAAIARALAVSPRLLILDEPVSALDAASRDRIIQSLRALRAQRGRDLGMLVISHDIGSLAAISDRLVVLYRGEIVESGPTRDLLRAPQHPYTRLLIASIPTLGGARSTRQQRTELRTLVSH